MLIDTLKWRCWHPMPQKMEYIKGNPGYPQDFNYMVDTRLHGSDGEQIWEGDIVFILADDNTVDYLKFNYRGGVFAKRGHVFYSSYGTIDPRIRLNSSTHSEGDALEEYDQQQLSVVGNIHQHPELLSARICGQCQTLNPQMPSTLEEPICNNCLTVSPPLYTKNTSGKLVSMNLNEGDIANAEKLKEKFHCANKATVVSIALSIVSSLADRLAHGEKLYICTKNGETQRLTIPRLGG